MLTYNYSPFTLSYTSPSFYQHLSHKMPVHDMTCFICYIMCVQSDTSLLEERHRQQLRDLEEAMKSTWEAKSKVRQHTWRRTYTHALKQVHPIHMSTEIVSSTFENHDILLHLSLPSLIARLPFFFLFFFLCPPLASLLSFPSDLYNLPLFLSFIPVFLAMIFCTWSALFNSFIYFPTAT